MSRVSMFPSFLAVTVIAVGLGGCGGEGTSDQPPPAAGQPEAAAGDEHAGHDQGGGEHAGQMPASTEVAKALGELSPEDRAAAEKQRICPVTNEPLGSMGKPFKITHQGTDVFLCCKMCKDSFTEEPEKYLAKLNE